MRNLLILGSGRSGTSMVAALFRQSGAFFGEKLLPPTPANPYGYYEDREVNDLNTSVIQCMIGALWTTRLLPWRVHPIHRSVAGSWLAAPWYRPALEPPAEVRAAMLGKFHRQPFCLKDPRFCVTLPVWRRWLPPQVRFLVVFRDPQRTADSILRDAVESYRPPLPVTPRWACLHWLRNYRRLLYRDARRGQWLFVHYDAVVGGAALPAIAAFAGAEVDASQIDPGISRARPGARVARGAIARRCARLYRRLCARAASDLRLWGVPGRRAEPATARGRRCAAGLPEAARSGVQTSCSGKMANSSRSRRRTKRFSAGL